MRKRLERNVHVIQIFQIYLLLWAMVKMLYIYQGWRKFFLSSCLNECHGHLDPNSSEQACRVKQINFWNVAILLSQQYNMYFSQGFLLLWKYLAFFVGLPCLLCVSRWACSPHLSCYPCRAVITNYVKRQKRITFLYGLIGSHILV